MRKHLANAGYGALDYVSYPVGMLLVAPIVLHRLGSAEYGLWMIATAVISAGGIIASGFCDACIQRVAYLRGTGESARMPQTIRSMMAINVLLGSVLAIGVWIVAPFAARHVGVARLAFPAECLIALRIASVAIFVRAVESVAVGVHRAFEHYRGTVRISTATRIATLATAAVLALVGYGIISILVATVSFLFMGTAMQFLALRKFFGSAWFWPDFSPVETHLLFSQGVFVWLQALGGVVFAQFDRILLGIWLGALAVTPYSLCVQFAHPIFGLSASGLNFLFPYLSGRAGNTSRKGLKKTVLKALACNLILVACGAAILLLVGDRLIRIWAGPAVAHSAAHILPPIVLGSAMLGLSVTGTYALQALGQFRTVAIFTLAGRAAMLLLMIDLLRHQGLEGLALSRLFLGAISLLVYLPLARLLHPESEERNRVSALTISFEAQEGSKL
ncbi:Polysaccharide biosynthesis protein [Candidatus Sulfotelmatomonas gaucii]|uniref:Polysaccharide biosynthesis protein n=1 Tax=Candidatus Sulfuritelmatomonas gaucii TaxID=2043161 RepID=A0A2N9LX48_9BACT|nr:Polysaccharide biosynthesis protein [Candidatus Sulfotelmatomonas gaucii]